LFAPVGLWYSIAPHFGQLSTWCLYSGSVFQRSMLTGCGLRWKLHFEQASMKKPLFRLVPVSHFPVVQVK
jgi:hypothetical protein